MREDKIKRLNRKLREEQREQADRSLHSRAYHRFFEGYSEYYERDGQGNVHLKRVYTGEYYCRELSRKQCLMLKLALGLIWLLSAAVFIFCASRPYAANGSWYVAAAQVGGIVGLVWMAFGLFNYFTVPQKMTVGDWKSASEKLKNGSICAAVFSSLTAIMTLLHSLLNGGGSTDVICIIGFAVCCGLEVLEHSIENRMPYRRIPSTATVPKEATYIW